jgi:DNA-binding XRE family transcriptional regulator
MNLIIQTSEELGLALRAVRKDSHVRLEDLAQTVGVSKQTAANVEQGEAKLSTMLASLREMGITLSVDIPQSAFPLFERLRHQATLRTAEADRDSD